ncbi:MAG: crossover junction endodeoxyribonuclease RuvC [Candidatus Pacebacteria bacterium]|nr:crossover junction endodeoxyribonuclease RuvC [Candidatus Paceibacterota bacterium]
MKNPDTITILGIDPGYDRLGWAITKINGSKLQVISYGCIQTNKKADIFIRYEQIITELNKVIKDNSPNELAIENLYFSKNTKTALRVSESRGVVITLALENKMRIFEYDPVTIKQSVTGYGKADKKSVEKMTLMQLGLTNKDKVVDDAIDALAVAVTHFASRKIRAFA